MIEAHATPLDYGFEHDGGDFLVMIRHQGGEAPRTARPTRRGKAAAGGFHEMVLGQEALRARACRRRDRRRSWRRRCHRDSPPAGKAQQGVPFGVPVLLGHLARATSTATEPGPPERPIQPFGVISTSFCGRARPPGMGQAAKHHVRHLAELGGGGRVELRHLVAVHAGPPGAHAIHQLAPVRQGEGHPLALATS